MFQFLQTTFAPTSSSVVRRPNLGRPVHRVRPAVEPLEDRWVPASTHIWIGPATGGLWNVAGNWTNGVPTGHELGGCILQFNGTIDSTDNITGLVIDELHFTSGGNTIRGLGDVSLGIRGSVLATSFQNDAGTNAVASLPLTLSGDACKATVTSGHLTLGGISGDQGLTLQAGSANGTLELSGAIGNTYAGSTLVSAGTLLLNKTNATAIPAGGLIVANGATVQLQQAEQIANTAAVTVDGGTLDLAGHSETVAALGSQNASSRALLGNATGTVLTVGFDHAFIDFDGTISGTGSVTVTGDGLTWRWFGATNNTYSGTTTVNAGSNLWLNKQPGVTAVPGDLVIASGGTVRLQQAEQIADPSFVEVDGVLDLDGHSETVKRVSGGSREAQVTLGNDASTVLTLRGVEVGVNYNGSISGAGGVTLDQGAQWWLTETTANTYSGTTTVTGGLSCCWIGPTPRRSRATCSSPTAPRCG